MPRSHGTQSDRLIEIRALMCFSHTEPRFIVENLTGAVEYFDCRTEKHFQSIVNGTPDSVRFYYIWSASTRTICHFKPCKP